MQIYYLGIPITFKGYRLCYTNHDMDGRCLGSSGRDRKDFCPLGCAPCGLVHMDRELRRHRCLSDRTS